MARSTSTGASASTATRPTDLALTATGRNMRLRYPEGVRSEVDADLSLTGRVAAPVLAGTVTVQNAIWTTRFDTSGNLFDFGGSDGGGVAGQWRPRRPAAPCLRCASMCA